MAQAEMSEYVTIIIIIMDLTWYIYGSYVLVFISHCDIPTMNRSIFTVTYFYMLKFHLMLGIRICDQICKKGSYTHIQFCDFKDV